MSIHPGEKKTRKGPTKEMGGEEALEQIGEKKTQDKDTKEKEEKAFKEKETNRIIAAGAAEATLLPRFFFWLWACLILFLGQLPVLHNTLKIFSYYSRSVFQTLQLQCSQKLTFSPTLLP